MGFNDSILGFNDSTLGFSDSILEFNDIDSVLIAKAVKFLKQFVYETFKLEGSWSQPGGDRKLFTFEDSTILWKKNQNLLSFNGSKANDFKNELCKRMIPSICITQSKFTRANRPVFTWI